MILDKKLNQLPLIKNNPVLQNEIFGKSDLDTFWVADMEFEISENIQKALIDRISNSSFGYEYYPDSFIKNRNDW